MTRPASGQSIAYVQGSRVTVRSQPSVVAPVAGYLTTNAETDVLERGAEWCRIRSTSTAPLSGFIACRFLADAPLTLEAIDARMDLLENSPREAILAWAGKPPSSAAAAVTTAPVGGSKYARFTAQAVDLNGDEIEDFLLRTGLAPAVVEPGDLIWKAVFANVDGKWVLAAFAQGLDCT